ncbi:hypothetical protein [Glycomyces buryatensis]|uniref:Uncharacterized protein n=1 Tax=Glycomyces buryatensis TaxID=2570927 RepID=A0A4S8Q8Z7_9ACTN|nr:hypothetical protein [Glycomyces buryatensis]THV40893.1 hypothetical protein FAB82_13650 [Glycomyces buryatensis]
MDSQRRISIIMADRRIPLQSKVVTPIKRGPALTRKSRMYWFMILRSGIPAAILPVSRLGNHAYRSQNGLGKGK